MQTLHLRVMPNTPWVPAALGPPGPCNSNQHLSLCCGEQAQVFHAEAKLRRRYFRVSKFWNPHSNPRAHVVFVFQELCHVIYLQFSSCSHLLRHHCPPVISAGRWRAGMPPLEMLPSYYQSRAEESSFPAILPLTTMRQPVIPPNPAGSCSLLKQKLF